MLDDNMKTQLEQHHKDCYSWALHCCKGDVGLASDVLQTAYLKILQRQITLRENRPLKHGRLSLSGTPRLIPGKTKGNGANSFNMKTIYLTRFMKRNQKAGSIYN